MVMLILRRFIGIIILTFLCVVMANAQSHRPTPSREVLNKPIQQHTSDKQQKPETDQRGTEQSPFIVKTINPPKTDTETEQERKDHVEKSAHDNLLVRYTGILAGVAILSFLALLLQAWYLCKGFKATEKAANAAKDSADVLPAIERAYIFVKITTNTPNISRLADIDGPPSLPINAKIIVTNRGRTPALLTGCPFIIDILDNTAIDERISKSISSVHAWIPPGTAIMDLKEQRKFPADFTMTKEKHRQINAGNVFLTCLGCIHYEDIFGNPHKTVFCWEYEQYIGFHPDEDPKRNYRT